MKGPFSSGIFPGLEGLFYWPKYLNTQKRLSRKGERMDDNKQFAKEYSEEKHYICWLCRAAIPPKCWHCWRCGHTQMFGPGWEFGRHYVWGAGHTSVFVFGDEHCRNPNCGFELNHGHQRFCPKCGYNIHWTCLKTRGRLGLFCDWKKS